MLVQKKSVCEGESKVENQVDCDVGPQQFINAALCQYKENQKVQIPNSYLSTQIVVSKTPQGRWMWQLAVHRKLSF